MAIPISLYGDKTNLPRSTDDKKEKEKYGGGNGGGSMDGERLATLEADVKNLQRSVSEIKTEVSNLRFWVITSAITIIFGLIVKIDSTVESSEQRLQVTLDRQWEASQKALDRNWEASQKSLDRNWEVAQDALKRIDASQSRIERMEIKQELNEEYSYPRPRIPSPKPQSK